MLSEILSFFKEFASSIIPNLLIFVFLLLIFRIFAGKRWYKNFFKGVKRSTPVREKAYDNFFGNEHDDITELNSTQKKLIIWFEQVGMTTEDIVGTMYCLDCDTCQTSMVEWLKTHQTATPSEIKQQALSIYYNQRRF